MISLKRLAGIFVIFLLAAGLTGCGEQEMKLSVTSEVEHYNPAMSSVPGLPLNAAFSSSLTNDNLKYHWVAEEGTFLKWQEQGVGKVKEIGNDVYTNEHKVYWGIGEMGIDNPAFKIDVAVENIETGKILAKDTITIVQDEEGFYIKK